ncbi:MAG: phosphate signaling complex protein PhoU [Eubacteriales bacterium]|nr:phosphate signaling complex protein PhoU [Eubacteriales bacterium]
MARFEKQLEELHVQLITMGSLCEQAITLSAQAIRGKGKGLCEQVLRTEQKIDEKEREIEGLCMRFLLHQHPVARDLREISAALKMITDMERIGDQAADIADLSQYIDDAQFQTQVNVEKMAVAAVKMVTESIDAFVNADLTLAKKVVADDDYIDEEFNAAKEELAGLVAEHRLDIKAALDLLMAAKYFERIGDHAVNIGEWVQYSITGTMK